MKQTYVNIACNRIDGPTCAGHHVSDADLLAAVTNGLNAAADACQGTQGLALVETAGGPASPGPSGNLQVSHACSPTPHHRPPPPPGPPHPPAPTLSDPKFLRCMLRVLYIPCLGHRPEYLTAQPCHMLQNHLTYRACKEEVDRICRDLKHPAPFRSRPNCTAHVWAMQRIHHLPF